MTAPSLWTCGRWPYSGQTSVTLGRQRTPAVPNFMRLRHQRWSQSWTPCERCRRLWRNSPRRWLSSRGPFYNCRDRHQQHSHLHHGLSPHRCQGVPGQVKEPLPASTVGSQDITRETVGNASLILPGGYSHPRCQLSKPSQCLHLKPHHNSIWGRYLPTKIPHLSGTPDAHGSDLQLMPPPGTSR